MSQAVALEVLFTPDDAAAAAQCNPVTIIRAIQRGELKASDISRPGSKRRQWRITVEQFSAWLEARANVPEPSPPGRRQPTPAQIEPPPPSEGPRVRRHRRTKPATGRLEP